MSRLGKLGFAAAPSLLLFAMVASVNAQTYNVSADWLSTYANTAATHGATSATWGAGGAWSAGVLSSNFTNKFASGESASGPGYESLTTYYNASTGYLNSGASVVATYTYTVPFQSYQLNPGTTYLVNMGQTTTEQMASTAKAYSGASGADTAPSSFTSQGAATGEFKEVGTVISEFNGSGKALANTAGFDIVGYGTGSFKSGGSSIQDTPAGVFYNYTTNYTSTSPAAGNIPSSAGDVVNSADHTSYSTVTLQPTFGPSYVAWTAPSAGTINVHMNAWDVGTNSNDGTPSVFVINSTAGPTAPLLSATSLVHNGVVGEPSAWVPGDGSLSSTVGTVATLSAMSGYNGGYGFNWTSGNITVTAGEKFYFVADPTRTMLGTQSSPDPWANHAIEGFQDPVALNDTINFLPSPEPSSALLLTIAGAGLALAAWKRRRVA